MACEILLDCLGGGGGDCPVNIPGGAKAVWITETDNVRSVTLGPADNYADAVVVGLLLRPGRRLINVNYIPDPVGAAFSAVVAAGAGSSSYTQSLVFNLAGLSATLWGQLRAMANQPRGFVAIVQDNNDAYYFLGDPKLRTGLRLSAGTAGTGRVSTELNGVTDLTLELPGQRQGAYALHLRDNEAFIALNELCPPGHEEPYVLFAPAVHDMDTGPFIFAFDRPTEEPLTLVLTSNGGPSTPPWATNLAVTVGSLNFDPGLTGAMGTFAVSFFVQNALSQVRSNVAMSVVIYT